MKPYNYEKNQENSNLSIFNRIGNYAKSKNLKVEYFTSRKYRYSFEEENTDYIYKDINFVQIFNDELMLSIYYDAYQMLALIPEPYYEIYIADNSDIYRFSDQQREILYELAKAIIDKNEIIPLKENNLNG